MANKHVSLMLMVVLVVVVMVLNVASQDDVSRDTERPKEMTETWTGWAVNKVWKGLGLKNDHPVNEEVVLSQQSPSDLAEGKDNVYDKATEKVHQAKQTAYDTAKEATDKASSLKDAAAEKVHEVTDRVKQFTKQASDNTIKIKDKAKQQAEVTTDKAEDVRDAVHKAAKEDALQKAEDTKEKVDEWDGSKEGESMSWVKSKAKEGYDGVKKRASKTLHNAKEMAKDMVAPQYNDDEL